jgi:hypothetical protein
LTVANWSVRVTDIAVAARGWLLPDVGRCDMIER